MKQCLVGSPLFIRYAIYQFLRCTTCDSNTWQIP